MGVCQFLLIILSISSSSLLVLSDAETCSAPRSDNDNDYTCHLQGIKSKIAYLESVHEESIRKLSEKMRYVEELEKLIQQMSQKIHLLQSTLFNLEADSSRAYQRLHALEEEVQRLWSASRKNNFDIHYLESKAQDAEHTAQTLASQVDKMSDIVTEQWMHIQRLEQAVHITEMRAFRAQRQEYSRCSFLKYINELSSDYLQKVQAMLDPYTHPKRTTFGSYSSQAWHHLKKVFTAIKTYHHQLQRYIKQEMEKNGLTAALANNSEFVFFVASALITFPIIIGWMFLSSQFG